MYEYEYNVMARHGTHRKRESVSKLALHTYIYIPCCPCHHHLGLLGLLLLWHLVS
jgi:hypothetical protein